MRVIIVRKEWPATHVRGHERSVEGVTPGISVGRCVNSRIVANRKLVFGRQNHFTQIPRSLESMNAG